VRREAFDYIEDQYNTPSSLGPWSQLANRLEGAAVFRAEQRGSEHQTGSRSLLLSDPVRWISDDLHCQINYHVHCPERSGLIKTESPRPSTEAGQLTE
jgi:hypothetical protein